MKHIITIMLAGLMLSAAPAFSQRFNGGLMAGIAGTQVAGDTYSGFHKAGLFAGGFVNLQFTPRSVVQMELEYFQKGSRENPDSTNNYTEYIFRANYIEMPILYQFVINDRFQVEAGPSAGFLVGHFEEYNDMPTSSKDPAKVTLQINVGLYVAITEHIKVNLRTNNSILNIRSENSTGDVYRFFDYGQYHDCLVLSAVYQFKNQSEDSRQ